MNFSGYFSFVQFCYLSGCEAMRKRPRPKKKERRQFHFDLKRKIEFRKIFVRRRRRREEEEAGAYLCRKLIKD